MFQFPKGIINHFNETQMINRNWKEGAKFQFPKGIINHFNLGLEPIRSIESNVSIPKGNYKSF